MYIYIKPSCVACWIFLFVRFNTEFRGLLVSLSCVRILTVCLEVVFEFIPPLLHKHGAF